jgi:hypothetical protein
MTEDGFCGIFGKMSMTERCFAITQMLTSIYHDSQLNGHSSECVSYIVSCVLFFVSAICEDLGIDIKRHVELKMRYNALRPVRNGKKY